MIDYNQAVSIAGYARGCKKVNFDDELAIAKTNGKKFFILKKQKGVRTLFNPLHDKNYYDNALGSNLFDFTEVSPDSFYFYLNFLETENELWLRKASRM